MAKLKFYQKQRANDTCWHQQRRRGLKRVGRAKVAIFRQTAAHFRPREIRVLKISILTLNSPSLRNLPPHSLNFEQKFYNKIFPADQNLGEGNFPLHAPAMTPLDISIPSRQHRVL